MDIASTIAMITGGVSALAIFAAVVVWFTKLARKVENNTRLVSMLIEMWFFDNERYAHTSSPVSLTTDGTTLLKESGAEEYTEKNKEVLLKQFEGITEPYDIQKKAGEVMIEELVQDKDIKDFVFRKGEKMGDIVYVAGIALRNVVFEHKNIDIEKYKD